jgi:hypothetical protein
MRIKNYNVLFAVSSCKGFYETTIDKNIWSLLEAGIERDSILLVMGDFQDPIEASNKEIELRNKFGIHKIYCEQQNSFEYTPMIHIVENQEAYKDYDYIFYMHDTCWVGPNFVFNLEKYFPEDGRDTCPLDITVSMNIGLYKISWLTNQIDRVLNCKNTSTDPRMIQLKKQWGVDFEDHLLKYQDGNFTELCGSRDQTIEIENPYGTSTPRRIRNFQYLDIYKAQSNWNGRLSEMNVTV